MCWGTARAGALNFTHTVPQPAAAAVAGLAPAAGMALLQSSMRVASGGPWTPAASNSMQNALLIHLQQQQDDR